MPGTAVFMTSTADGVPHALLHNLKHNKVLHERIILLTVKIADVPYHPMAERVYLDHLGQGFHRVVLKYGFMEEPDVPAALNLVSGCGDKFKMMDTSFFLARQTLLRVGQAGDGDLARKAVRVDAAERRKRDGILPPADQPRGRAGEPGRDLTRRARRSSSRALFGGEDQAWFDRQRAAHFPPERNFLDAHLTMFHHLPPSLEGEVRQRLSEAARGGAPAARIAGLISLGRGVAYRIDSPALEDVRAHLADVWSGLLTPQDQAGWRPHVTIQNKVDPADARALLDRSKARFPPASARDRRLCRVVVSRRPVGAAVAPHVRLTAFGRATYSPPLAAMRAFRGGVAQLVRARES